MDKGSLLSYFKDGSFPDLLYDWLSIRNSWYRTDVIADAFPSQSRASVKRTLLRLRDRGYVVGRESGTVPSPHTFEWKASREG